MRLWLGLVIIVAAMVAGGCGVAAQSKTAPQSAAAYAVWARSDGGEPRIYAASSLDPLPAAVSAKPAGQYLPTVSRDWIAWVDRSSGGSDIVLLDRRSGQTRVAARGVRDQWFPAVSADWLLWARSTPTGSRVRALSLRSGERLALDRPRPSMSAPRPRLSGSWVTWLQQGRRISTVWAYDLDARQLVRIARGRCTAPAIAAGIIAYRDAVGIHCVDPASGDELRLVRLGKDSGVVGDPLMSEGQVLWATASENGTVFDLWSCALATGEQRRLLTFDDMDPSMGLAVSGHSLVYVGTPDAGGSVPVCLVDLRSAHTEILARQSGHLTGPALIAE